MPPLHPMREFDPSLPAIVHDRRNDRTFEWSPDWRANYKRYAVRVDRGIVSWDGLLLDGWAPIEPAGHPFSPQP